MKRILFLLMLAACSRQESLAPPSVPVVSVVATAGISSQPNIVLILTDDQTTSTMAALPNVRQLFGNEGVTFTNGFVTTALCCPSRSSILSGQYSHNTGVKSNQDAGLFNDTATLATWLQTAGYRTGLFGKYLNGYATTTVPPGWNDWHVFYNQTGGTYFDYQMNENGAITNYGSTATDYSTDVIRAQATNFIRQPDARPFFVYFSPTAPHVPSTPAPRHANLFNNLAPWRPASYNESDVSDKPAWVRAIKSWSSYTQSFNDTRVKNQWRSLVAVDEAVAHLVALTDSLGQTANTIFIYMSDNGQCRGEHRWWGKLAAYDESIRVPFYVRARGLVTAPRTQTQIVANIDLAATICDYAGIVPTISQNGRSIRPLIDFGSVAGWRTDLLHELLATDRDVPNYYAVRNVQHTYVEYGTGERELYDHGVDVFEMQNKAGKSAYSIIQAQLAARLQQLKGQ